MGNSQDKAGDDKEQVNLHHFKFLNAIGRGGFSKVRIVKHKVTKKQYALKYFAKDDVIQTKMTKSICRERDILVNIHHPFICNLRYAFQDDYNLYMALDLMTGGDLRFQFKRRQFDTKELIFITAELMSAIGYLHNLEILHRDIKPDNILFDDRGHAHLTDFNIATYLKPDTKLYSNSGTLCYMAPEQISGDGYDYAIDWWSLGVTIFEAYYQRPPYPLVKGGDTAKILSTPINWDPPTTAPPDPHPEFLPFLKLLLTHDPHLRVPNPQQGFPTFRTHPLFHSLPWSPLLDKSLTPPFQPHPDKSHFDLSHNLEELLLEDEPLESILARRARKRGRRQSEVDAKSSLATDFPPYDFYTTVASRRLSVDYSKDLPQLPLPTTTSSMPDGDNGNLNISSSPHHHLPLPLPINKCQSDPTDNLLPP